MIVIEKVLMKAFDTLPAMRPTIDRPEGFKPYYAWGNEFHLIRQSYLKKKDLYPLIYQTSNRETQNDKAKEATTNLRLILAVDNPIQEELNESRWAESYDNVLFPLLNNIITLFTKGQIFVWDKEYTVTKFPNYGFDTQGIDQNANPNEIWDAILFETDIKITEGCLNEILYTKTT